MELNGILIVNKPKDFTSNDVVNKIKHLLHTKVGHTGTLDPNATGVLPLLLGKGTKFSKYLINHDKKYIATLKLGIKTTSADVEGEVIEEKEVNESIFDKVYLEKILNTFIGKIIQTPPIYSAIKVNGKKLYEYARKNQEVEIPKRAIEIYNIGLISYDVENKLIVFEVECSKGTYIRSLCEDIAEKLETVGYMIELQRARVGNFFIENSVDLDEVINNYNDKNWLNKNIIDFEKLLEDKPKVNITSKELEKFLNGVKINKSMQDGICLVYSENSFIGSGIVSNNELKRDVIL